MAWFCNKNSADKKSLFLTLVGLAAILQFFGAIRIRVDTEISINKISSDHVTATTTTATTTTSDSRVKASPKETIHKTQGLKYILYYTPFFLQPDFGFGYGSEPFEENCQDVRQQKCFATNDSSLLGGVGEFDAALFHLPNMMGTKREFQVEVPEIADRRHNQRFVMFMREAPFSPSYFTFRKGMRQRHNFTYGPFKDFFNWTMTVRTDSDIPNTHGWFQGIDNRVISDKHRISKDWLEYNETKFKTKTYDENKDDYSAIWQEKDKLVSWVVSHCWTNSKREDLVDELTKYVDIDIFGNCIGMSCDSGCFKQMPRRSKFYLAFENNICRDYVTEKFWYMLSTQLVVPIVFGGDNYKRLAPPHSYIQVEDFESIGALAKYLKFLGENPIEYFSYFWWHEHYRAFTSYYTARYAMCDLCGKLNDENEPEKVIHDLKDWWWTQSQCKHA